MARVADDEHKLIPSYCNHISSYIGFHAGMLTNMQGPNHIEEVKEYWTNKELMFHNFLAWKQAENHHSVHVTCEYEEINMHYNWHPLYSPAI